MNEHIETTTEVPAAPKKAPVRRKKRKVAAKRQAKSESAVRPVKTGDELDGISATACPSACTADHCVISTVGICKHPYKTSDSGCGPITMQNRLRARKLIKHQIVELKG